VPAPAISLRPRASASYLASLGLVLAFALVHLPMLGVLPLSGDEAYYWECSTHLDWSYSDMPRLVIDLLGVSTRLFGATEHAARLPSVAIGLGTGDPALLVPFTPEGRVRPGAARSHPGPSGSARLRPNAR